MLYYPTLTKKQETMKKNVVTVQPYQKAITYETEYDPEMTTETAYDFIKTLPIFNEAIDI